MSDIYNLWNTETKKEKSKLRGFSLAQSRDIEEKKVYLKNILATLEGTKYVYYTERPSHLGECITHRKVKSIEKDLNVFTAHKKTIDINGDTKRLWDKDFKSGKSCLKETHQSLPIMIGV